MPLSSPRNSQTLSDLPVQSGLRPAAPRRPAADHRRGLSGPGSPESAPALPTSSALLGVCGGLFSNGRRRQGLALASTAAADQPVSFDHVCDAQARPQRNRRDCALAHIIAPPAPPARLRFHCPRSATFQTEVRLSPLLHLGCCGSTGAPTHVGSLPSSEPWQACVSSALPSRSHLHPAPAAEPLPRAVSGARWRAAATERMDDAAFGLDAGAPSQPRPLPGSQSASILSALPQISGPLSVCVLLFSLCFRMPAHS